MSAYQSIIDVLADVAEEPEASAIKILQTLRTMPNEVVQAGVDPGQWEKACEAMITVASKTDGARRAKHAEVRREDWPGMVKQLEQSGCTVTNRDGQTWGVIGTGVAIDINLSTGDVDQSDGEQGGELPEFERIVDYIIGSVTGREIYNANLARRAERRKTHRWDNQKKVWLPLSGVGAVIKRGE